jgi:uncharacterized protein (DUF983 family)
MIMSFKETKIYSIVNAKCPRCHEGDFYATANPYNLKKFDKMNSRCAKCGQDFEREPGFYFGATYASYAMTVAFGILMYLLSKFIFNLDDLHFLYFFPLLIILLAPIFFRTSRLIWINVFVKYNPNALK